MLLGSNPLPRPDNLQILSGSHRCITPITSFVNELGQSDLRFSKKQERAPGEVNTAHLLVGFREGLLAFLVQVAYICTVATANDKYIVQFPEPDSELDTQNCSGCLNYTPMMFGNQPT